MLAALGDSVVTPTPYTCGDMLSETARHTPRRARFARPISGPRAAAGQREGARALRMAAQRTQRAWIGRGDCLCVQYLADAGLAGDEHGQLARTDAFNFPLELSDRGVLVDGPSLRLTSRTAKSLALLMLVRREPLESLDPLCCARPGRGQTVEDHEQVQTRSGEAASMKRVQRQQAPERVIDMQCATDAVLDFDADRTRNAQRGRTHAGLWHLDGKARRSTC